MIHNKTFVSFWFIAIYVLILKNTCLEETNFFVVICLEKGHNILMAFHNTQYQL